MSIKLSFKFKKKLTIIKYLIFISLMMIMPAITKLFDFILE